jgi:ClpP class serine protease
LGEIFLKTVARGRDCDDDEAMAWATGGVWLAKEAMAMGLIDGVATRDQMLACERAGNQPRGGMEGDMEGKQTGPSVEEKISAAKAEATAAERARLATFCEEFAGYRDFAVEQFAAGKSLDEARVAFVGVLKAELAAGKAELVKVSGEKATAEAKLAEALKASAAAAAVAEPAAAKPIENAGSPQGAASVDFVARARDLAKEKQISITAAMKQLAAAEPEAHKAYLAGQRPVKVRDGK